ncbi:phosphoribosylformimino-5-aminoimidazole carboxamide ribotide isomerase [Pelagophyceae sp. CCMP2097]|nr:phosphoribosylformimino-5-aminoimidazole carboxamide ribotide isomerase [Pelagophyceae sp. CCMP2097]
MKFRPCIDLHGGVVKQIVGGTLNDAEAPTENFVSDLSAAHYASLYKRDGLIGGHVIMLGGGNDGPAREALAAHPGALHVGGGVTADNARAWLDAGASHVIVTSWIFQDGELSEQRLDAVVAAVGSDKLILDLSCRKRDGKYYVVTDRWQNFTSLEVCKETLDRLGEKCAEFLVHGVDVEGTRLGIDDELVVLLGATSPLPVTYAGGAASLEDLSRVEKLGGGKVDLTIGSALDIFGGAVPYADVVAWHDARQ